MLKKRFVLPLALTAAAAQAHPLPNFDAVSNAIKHGENIRVVMNFEQCETNAPTPLELIGSFSPKSVLIAKNKHIVFSNVHFTTFSPAHLGVPLYEYTQYVLNPDNTFMVKNQHLNPVTFEKVGTDFKMKCKLGEGVHIFDKKPIHPQSPKEQ